MKKRGFTLIELLVVVAIIGMLASMITINMWSQKDKARDVSIQSYLHQVRNAAEFSYIQNQESYGFICDESDDTLSDDNDFGRLERAILKENNNQPIKCFESADKKDYAISSPLVAASGKYWCIETAGASIEIDSQINSASCN